MISLSLHEALPGHHLAVIIYWSFSIQLDNVSIYGSVIVYIA